MAPKKTTARKKGGIHERPKMMKKEKKITPTTFNPLKINFARSLKKPASFACDNAKLNGIRPRER